MIRNKCSNDHAVYAEFIMSRWFAAIVLYATISGCATDAQKASLQCGASGAIAGFLLCKAAGKSDNDCAKVAAVVGVGGAAVCYSYTSNLERRRRQLAGRENDLDSRIEYARSLNEDIIQLSIDLDRRVRIIVSSTNDFVNQVREGRVAAADIARERQYRGAEVEAANSQVQAAESSLMELKEFRAQQPTPSPGLDAEIFRQEQLIDAARHRVRIMVVQRARV